MTFSSRSAPVRSLPKGDTLPSWVRALVRHRGGLRVYQWLWIVLCVVGASVAAAPRLLSRPIIYQAEAQTRFDVQRFAGLYKGAEAGYDLNIAMNDARDALRQRFLAQGDVRFGRPDFRVGFILREPGTISVQGVAASATSAQQLANMGAEELVRQVRAAGGREVLRNMLGWETLASLRGQPATTRFQQLLRMIVERNAFPLSRPIEPVSKPVSLELLSAEEQSDLTRAMEARYDRWTFEINARNTALDTFCNSAVTVTGSNAAAQTASRERALQQCATNDISADAELRARNEAIERRNVINNTLNYLRNEAHIPFALDSVNAAYRVVAALPDAPVPRNIEGLMLLAVVLGLGMGVTGVAVDRSAKVTHKIRDLWQYRSLIINLTLRDLRARYKGSALGYIWTQLAPLLMMLVFLVVFTVLMPSGIALFPVFLIVGLLPWNFAAEAISNGTRSVIDNSNLIKKIYFPREVLPLTSVFSALLNYVLSLPMMLLVMAGTQWFVLGRLNFTWTFAYLPVLLFLQTLFLLGMVLLLSALAVFVRDLVHLIGIFIQVWFFLTPVFYSLDTITPNMARVIRWLNPMASLIDFYRESLYGNTVSVGMVPTPGLPALDGVLRVFITSLAIFGVGAWVFRRVSGRFGEEL